MSWEYETEQGDVSKFLILITQYRELHPFKPAEQTTDAWTQVLL